MSTITKVELAIAATLLLIAALAFTTFARKSWRDRREESSRSRRRELREAMKSGGERLDRLFAELQSRIELVDLSAALALDAEALGPLRRSELHRAARESGLLRRLERILGSSRPHMRGLAAIVIGAMRTPDAVALLDPLLRDPDPEVRLAACAAIAQSESREAAFSLLEALSAGNVPADRVIERVAEPWAVEYLLGALASIEIFEGGHPAQVSAARALGLAGELRAETALLRLLRNGDLEARISAARALGDLGCPGVRTELEAALSDEAWPLRAQAARSLGETLDPHAVPALYGALGDQAWWVRANAANALRRLGEPGIAALQHALNHQDAFARDRAREALGLEGLATHIEQIAKAA